MKKFSGVLLLCAVLVGGCGLQPPPITALWTDIHPQGWVVFTGSRPPFPPPTQPYSYVGYDDKLLLYHPHLGTVITLLEDTSDTFSWPRWDVTSYRDRLYWLGGHRRIYRLVVDFTEIERAISNPLGNRLPLSLKDAELLWTDEEGAISALAPSPDGRLLAFLREYQSRFSVVVLDVEQSPAQRIAELPTAWLSQVHWTADGQGVLLVREDPTRSVPFDNQQLPVGMIVRHEIATGQETTLAEGVVLFQPSGENTGGTFGLGLMSLAPDGSVLYYVTLATLRPRTAQDLRLGLYRLDLGRRVHQLVMELPAAEMINNLALSPSGRRVAFTVASYRVGAGFSFESALYIYDSLTGGQAQRLVQLVNGQLFPLWLDDAHLVYVQFQVEMGNETSPEGVRPALWVHNVETGERFNHLPLLTMQAQIESLRLALRHLQERVAILERAVHELQARRPPGAPW